MDGTAASAEAKKARAKGKMVRAMAVLSKLTGWILVTLLAFAVQARAEPIPAYEISVLNPSNNLVIVEAFVIGPDLSCLGLGQKQIAPGGRAKWNSRGLCPGGLAGQVHGQQGWTTMTETSCLGAARNRHDWTSCCRNLNFKVCPAPGGGAGFCMQ